MMIDPELDSSSPEGEHSSGDICQTIEALPFHPSFASQSPSNIVLTVDDGTAFSFSFKTLTSTSSFFRSLEHLPTTSPSGQVLIVPVPAASAASLRLLLTALSPDPGRNPLALKPKPNEVGTLMRAVDAYDLHHALAVLSTTLAATDETSTSSLIMFVLAALTADEDLAEETALHTLSWDMADFPTWAQEVLMHWAPRYLARLYAYHCKCRRSSLTGGAADQSIRF